MRIASIAALATAPLAAQAPPRVSPPRPSPPPRPVALPLCIAEPVALFFEPGSAVMPMEAGLVMDEAIKRYADDCKGPVVVAANVDSSEPAGVSAARGHAVRDALVKRGVAVGRIRLVDNGASKPLVPGVNAQNRYVTVTFNDAR